ncbi:MAG TPA: hypothetical protein VFQ38_06290 [Longimicrobiales bacterium]|nr:hypothetical protein [Longimicrobiales bacterium]
MTRSSRRGAACGRGTARAEVRHPWACALVALAALGGAALPAAAQFQGRGAPQGPPASQPAHVLKFRYMGPPSAGRVAAVAGVPGDTTTYYLGAASGGVWKTTDGGRSWAPLFDEQPVQAIGALAVSRTNPQVVWAGTGEAWAIRDADVMGDGVYKSEDGGKSWKNMGLVETGRIGRIVIHPTNPDIVFVCALGRTTGPQEERGVYRTVDGGKSWRRVLFVNPNTGCSGLAMDPKDPDVLFAGTWEVVMHTWAMFSGGAGSGVWVSRDGGTSWTRIKPAAGLPKSPVGKVDVAVAPSSPQRVYALIQTADQGSLWRSDDGGRSWRAASWDRRLIGRAGYYIRVTVSPKNADEVHVMNSSSLLSTDGGLTFPRGVGGCGDCHDEWIDPLNPDHWVTTGDGGAGITRDHGKTYASISLPIGQMYHVALDERTPYWIYSNRQDDGTMRGRSDSPVEVPNVPAYGDSAGVGSGGIPGIGGPRGERRGGEDGQGGRGGPPATDTAQRGGGERAGPPPAAAGARQANPGGQGAPGGRGPGGAPRGGRFGPGGGIGAGVPWQAGIGGCESGFTLPLPSDPDIIWASCYGNTVTRFDNGVGRARHVAPWMHTLDSEPNKAKYRCHWTPPLAIDPFDPETVYYGCQVVFRTRNQGQSWDVISPDLSTNDSRYIVSSGGIIGDNLGQFYGEVVFAIAPSPAQRGLIWAGTNDGQLWYTRDGGGNWTNVTKNMTGLPAWGTIRQIAPSHFDPAAAYVAIDFHMMDDREPYLYKTSDYGRTWTKISGGLPSKHPLAYVMSVAENPNRRGMLFAGTGNGFFYSMDDGATWTRFNEGLPAAPVTWIEVQKEYHDVVVSTYGRGLFIMHDITALENADKVPQVAEAYLYPPRAGVRAARTGNVDILYMVKGAPAAPLRLEILNDGGKVIRTLEVRSHAGLNRTSWDLTTVGPRQVELRTTPPDNPHIWEEARFKGKDTRPINHWGIQQPQRAAPIVPPGKYAVRMTVGTQSYTQPFEVVKDPSITSSVADLAASSETQERIVADMDQTVDMINRLEVVGKQVEDRLKARPSGDAAAALRSFEQKRMSVLLQLLSRTDLHSDDKWYVEAYRIYMNLIWLYGEVGTGAGDVQGGAEYRPTDASLATLATLEQQLAQARKDYDRLMQQDLVALNQALAGKITITDGGTP